MTINYTMTTLVWLVLLAVWFAVDLPNVHVLILTLTSLAVVGLLPLLLYRPSKTTWAAIDYLVFRSSPDYRSRDAADRAAGNGGHI